MARYPTVLLSTELQQCFIHPVELGNKSKHIRTNAFCEQSNVFCILQLSSVKIFKNQLNTSHPQKWRKFKNSQPHQNLLICWVYYLFLEDCYNFLELVIKLSRTRVLADENTLQGHTSWLSFYCCWLLCYLSLIRYNSRKSLVEEKMNMK